ncbi:MAG: FAD:protein FMN transferase [Actinomycetales bacterium]|nr:FAD:protein FMN transferase [Actinomycetales bacterium]
MRTHFATMGTEVSIEAEGELAPARVAELRRAFDRVDRTFSLYRTESELSRIAAGALALTDASDDVRSAYDAALSWRTRTRGAFTPHRPDGVLDLSGLVKATAMAEAGVILDRAIRFGELDSWRLGVGGDVLRSAAGVPARVGIVDPLDLARLLTVLQLGPARLALATSGSAERGDHIWMRDRGDRAHDAAPDFVQVSVAARDIVTADVLATAIVSGGAEALDEICEREDVDVLTVDRSGGMRATPGFAAAIEAARS